MYCQLTQVFVPAAKQSTLGRETLQSLNLSLGVSPMREEGGGRQWQGHPQPLPSSHEVGQWWNAVGTMTCLSLLWAARGKGTEATGAPWE